MIKNKRGISLIVLVITIIIMIILAAAVVITLSNTNIINRANEGVDAWDLNQVQHIATLAWAEEYLAKHEGKISVADYEGKVNQALTNNGIDPDDYIIEVSDSGVSVEKSTLGNLIKSAADYGKSVVYTVTRNGTEYKDWQVFYEDPNTGYVYIIMKDSTLTGALGLNYQVSTMTDEERELYKTFNLGKNVLLSDNGDAGYTAYNDQAVLSLIRNYSNFANKTTYGEYVIGAIGGPTLELLAAGWTAKGNQPEIGMFGSAMQGYGFAGEYGAVSSKQLANDGLYICEGYSYWLATPGMGSTVTETWNVMVAGNARIGGSFYEGTATVRPVVCLSGDIPAKVVANGYSLAE